MDSLPEEIRIQVEGLRDSVRRGRRRCFWLGNGTAAAVVLGLICLAAYYAAAVLSYAEVDQDFQIRRDLIDSDLVTLTYGPASSGTISFGRDDGNRRTEVLDRVGPESIGKQQTFRWRIRGLETGEPIWLTHLDGWWRNTRQLRVPPPIGGSLRGKVVNAINNAPVPNALVGIAGTSLSTRADAEGNFRIDGTPVGSNPVEVAADGFTAVRFERALSAGEEDSVRVALSPGLEEGQIRIVLTWGREPQDLDAHLEGPLPDGQPFHVSHRNMGNLQQDEFVRLDTDNQGGWGPETITVLGVAPGTYRYYVHDYTHRDDLQSDALSTSGAEVRLYQRGQQSTFRAEGGRAGNVWEVCTIEVTPEGEAIVKKVDRHIAAKSEQVTEEKEKYELRTEGNRLGWIPEYGGTVGSEEAVAAGLAWLARHQAPDGFWSSECLVQGPLLQCEGEDPCPGHGSKYEMAQTGLALLAFQAGGHYYFNGADYSKNVRDGLNWMVAHQRPDGALVSERSRGGHSRYHTYYMYDHGIATFALADACASAVALGQLPQQEYLEACRKAVRYIESQQHFDGGWRYTDKLERPSDTSVSGWQALALKSAQDAGIEVSGRCIEKIRDFFRLTAVGRQGRTWYRKDRFETKQESEATTGIGMLVRQFLLDEPDAPMIHDAARYLAALAEKYSAQGVVEQRSLEYRLEYNYYMWYNCMLAMFQVGGEPWNRWNRAVRDTVLGLQRTDGCTRGSWDPDTRWGDRGGRIYTTALAILTLEAYYRYARRSETSRMSP